MSNTQPFPSTRILVASTAAALSLLGASGTVHADERAQNSLRTDVGVASPIGEIGIVYGRSLSPNLAAELGVGMGGSGLQLSAMGKLVLGRGATRFTPGLGLSVGVPISDQPMFHEGHPDDETRTPGPAVAMVWADFDVIGFQLDVAGFTVALSGGVTVALSDAHFDVMDIGGDVSAGAVFPQLRIGAGWSF
jgi:hypothetical protein